MPDQPNSINGRRVSYDGALCTVKCRIDSIPNTKGDWLGVEWDDPARGKHNGTLHGVRYFQCRSDQPSVASFVRPTRKPDPERCVLDAIKYKYASGQPRDEIPETVVISGKVAEEIGFEKIIKAQSMLSNLKVVILDFMVVTGVAARRSSPTAISRAQEELATTCPNVTELDLSYNPIEDWSDIEDICAAFPKLRILKLNSIRLRSLESGLRDSAQDCFRNIQELHLNECLLDASNITTILQGHGRPKFPALRNLWLSQNELSDFNTLGSPVAASFDTIHTVMLENNKFTTLDPVASILSTFPQLARLSLQSNQIDLFGSEWEKADQQYTLLSYLNLSRNVIDSYEFIDHLPQVFTALTALRISHNPVYDRQPNNTSSVKPSEISYYLTLARIPRLKSLNYTDITPREREEGEIYYLSIAEKDIRTTLTGIKTQDAAATAAATRLRKRYTQYERLCEKHDRDNVLAQIMSTPSDPSQSIGPIVSQPVHPPGTLASRLVTATFYLANSPPSSLPVTSDCFTRPIPSTIATSSIFALVSRELHIPSLTFRLVYESEELDPVRDDMTTRSQIDADPAKGARRWDDWGDWDADAAVERSLKQPNHQIDTEADGGRWTDEGVLIKGGRKWRKRQVEMLFGRGGWGDWLDQGTRTCKIRVEPVERKKF